MHLPSKAKMFLDMNKSWKKIMTAFNHLPNALHAHIQPGVKQQHDIQVDSLT